MEEELKLILKKILDRIPADADFSSTESSLYKIEELLEKQNNFFKRIAESLENIEENMPSPSSISTDHIESLLDRLNDKYDTTTDKLDNINSTLTDISYNTQQ